MPADLALELRPTIDRRWLERAAEREPLAHAYTLWDLDRAPSAVRVVSAVRGATTLGYLLIWLGRRDRPIVHWYGPVAETPGLVEGFPVPPFVAVVPEGAAPLVLRAFPTGQHEGLTMMLRDRGAPVRPSGAARPLTREDRPALEELARRESAPELAGYAGIDPGAEPLWGTFEGGRLVGVARAGVRLPSIWVVNGVFVSPERRGRGYGAAVVSAVVAEAARHGAPCGLYVRDAAAAARRLYSRLGFREVGRRAWIDVGATGAA